VAPGDRPLLRRAAAPAAFAIAALVPALLLRGFTVDDALIPARYAAHLARGLGYRFNAGGPVTDGVTPLGFPILLAPFARGGPLAALAAAKTMGLAAWTLAAAVLGLAVDRVGGARLRFAAVLIVACSAPLAAWSVAGLETGLAAALAALAVSLPGLARPRAGAVSAGLAAALRPELLPWALTVAVSPARDDRDDRDDPPARARARAALRIAIASAPFAAVVALRLAIFGHPVPLSVLAKPSDAVLGAKYALACFLLTGPLAILAPFAWRRLGGFARGLVAAVLVHFVAIALAGGDWMPLSRLAVPVLPGVALAFAHLAAVADARATLARLAIALAGEIFQLASVGPAAAKVGADRMRVIDELRGPLAGARTVAALDVGWLGAATDATIVDLAGLTDPAIAALPGGHTSKAIPSGLLDARGVDAIVLLLKDGEPLVVPWTDAFFARIVEIRVSSFEGMGERFAPVAEAHVPHLAYVVLLRNVAQPVGDSAMLPPPPCPKTERRPACAPRSSPPS
jgi:hypothetical protein